jgi:hypothetical protein
MSKTISNNHPLIQNSNLYFLEKKYITISSDDRDITKYPNSAEFEMLLPQEYLNVASARLYSWSFPANYNVFSPTYFNVTMTFKLNKIYNPGEYSFSNVLVEGIFAALYYNRDYEFVVKIETGFYNPAQMANELTNRFNYTVTKAINDFFSDPSLWNGNDYNAAKVLFEESPGYDRFKIVYNSVAQKLWFGNNADQFTLTNSSSAQFTKVVVTANCLRRNQLPEWSNWGLPAYLGFSRCDATSYTVQEYLEMVPEGLNNVDYNSTSSVPRFFYGEGVPGSGDSGYWLIPILPGAVVTFLEAPFKINFMGPAYMYMEIEGWNCIDETAPYNLSLYTSQNNQTNGIVNSCFAKIAIPTTPISQWFDANAGNAYKYWNPPAERLSKIKVKLRYHNGVVVQMGLFDYSFMIELTILKPQHERSYAIVDSDGLTQRQGFASRFF